MSTSQDTKTADRQGPPSPGPAVVSDQGLGPQETTSHREPGASYHAQGRGAYTMRRDFRLAWCRKNQRVPHRFEPSEGFGGLCAARGCGLIRSHIVHDHDLFETPEQTKRRVEGLTRLLRDVGALP